jgi:hypothetical protein
VRLARPRWAPCACLMLEERLHRARGCSQRSSCACSGRRPANGSADTVHRLTAAIALLRWGNLGMSGTALASCPKRGISAPRSPSTIGDRPRTSAAPRAGAASVGTGERGATGGTRLSWGQTHAPPWSNGGSTISGPCWTHARAARRHARRARSLARAGTAARPSRSARADGRGRAPGQARARSAALVA